MFLNYNNLWKTLIDKGVKKGELCKMTGISTSTLSKMNRNEPVSLSIVWVNHFFYVIHQPLTRRHSTLTVA